MPKDLKEDLVEFANTATARADRVTSEEAAKQYMVLPFFQFLGYDPLNPDEIIPESHASFSDKFKNRVDYAICIAGEPVIAVECKKTGELNTSHRGELKGYFNAVPTVKLGILTDGLVYELFSDTDAENMMDTEPFVRVDLSSVAKGRISDQALDAVNKLRKGTFDPVDVGADAKRKIFIARYVDVLDSNFTSPTEEFVRSMLDIAEVDARKTSKLLEEHKPMIRDALSVFLDRKILERVGFANRQDIVKMQQTADQEGEAAVEDEEQTDVDTVQRPGVITTDTELQVYGHTLSRLAFLVDSEEHYNKIQELRYTDYKTVFIVYYKQERKGRLYNFREGPDGEYRFDFPELEDSVQVKNLLEIDDLLLASFYNRVRDLDAD
jgi:hypothetical protein